MITLENRVGRLVELTVVSPVTPPEVQACMTRMMAVMSSIKGKFIIVGDVRNTLTLAPEIADSFSQLMRVDNPRIERSGLLLGESATVGLQVERVVREAKNPVRRTFRSVAALVSWIGEVTSAEEIARVSELLAQNATTG